MSILTLEAKLQRQESSTPWGFRMQGGTDFSSPITIARVTPGSLAAKCGLQQGDIILKIGSKASETLKHKDAQDAILSYGNKLDLLLQRIHEQKKKLSGFGGGTQNAQTYDKIPTLIIGSYQSPAAPSTAPGSQSYNTSPKPFGSIPSKPAPYFVPQVDTVTQQTKNLNIKSEVQIWKPKVTPMSELRPETKQPVHTATGDELYLQQKTSLARDHTDEPGNIGSSYNRPVKPFSGFGGGAPSPLQQQPQQPQYGGQQPYGGFGGGAPSPLQQQPQQPQYGGQQPYGGQKYGGSPRGSSKRAVPKVVHAQFNSPIGLYSAGNIAQTYAQQTAGIQKEMENLDVKDAPVGTKMTGTYQRLDSDTGSQSYDSHFGTPASPTAAPGDDAVTISASDPTSGSPKSFQNNLTSESTERFQAENGVLSDEHAPSTETNNVINPSQPSGLSSMSAPSASAPKQESMHFTGYGSLVL